MNLAIVPITLSAAAPLMPRSTSQFMIQNMIDATSTACHVFPPLKYGGRNELQASISSTPNPTLPKADDSQYPHAIWKPAYLPKPLREYM